jgi:hypothetical protein
MGLVQQTLKLYLDQIDAGGERAHAERWCQTDIAVVIDRITFEYEMTHVLRASTQHVRLETTGTQPLTREAL